MTAATVLQVVAAARADLTRMSWLHRKRVTREHTDLTAAHSLCGTGAGRSGGRLRRTIEASWSAIRSRAWAPISEIALIVTWGIWLGLPYLDTDRTVWPVGREFGFQLQSHYFWIWLRECGVCALWNGGINGGYPALAEVYGAPLHPLIALTTLAWGTVVGARVSIVLSFCLAGIAQWWMARAMGLRWPARLWAGLAAVVGGHITGRMDLAGVSLILSTATASLTLAAMLDLGLTGRRKSALLLGLLGAFSLLSGQGYLQVALFGWVPFLFLFLLRGANRLRPLLREYALAMILAVMLAGLFLIPSLHFRPNIQKDFDLLFETGQPLEYIPLNLVIRDVEFMRTELLGKLPIPHLSNLYIGWAPILLVGLALPLRRAADWPALSFLIAGTAASFVLASGVPFRWLVPYATWLGMVRHVSLLAGLAVPGILAIAAYGLDAALRLAPLSLTLHPLRGSGVRLSIPAVAWMLAIPLAAGLRTSFVFARTWLGTGPSGWAYDVASGWRTPDLEWVQPPYGDHNWLEVSLGVGLKVSTAWYPWSWAGRTTPEPRIEVTWSEPSEGAVFLREREGMATYLHPDRHYAFVLAGGEIVPCVASGGGGDILVRCSSGREGLLIVQENSWNGWRVWVDGEAAPLVPGIRLAVRSLPGTHEYRFRYLPWDVPLGLALTVMGSAATIILYVRADKAPRRRTRPSGRSPGEGLPGPDSRI